MGQGSCRFANSRRDPRGTVHAHAHADQQTGTSPRSHRTRASAIRRRLIAAPVLPLCAPLRRPLIAAPLCAHRFIFSALTIPLPRFPPRSRPPDARAHPPRPMSAFSARVNIAPSESPARECPDGPSPSARPDPPPRKQYITPPSPESLVCWMGECVIDDPRVRLHRDSTFFSFPIGELGRRHNTRRRRRRPSSIRLSRGRSIVSKTNRRRSRTPRTTGRRERHRSLGLSDFH